jgi:soluble lytic murein transglycosylase-like protein
VPAPAQVPQVTEADTGPFSAAIKRAAERYKLPADLIRAVMKVESGYKPEATSVKGAVGLMQLMPATAAAMGVKDPRDPQQNIMGGARFLRVLANRFRGDLVKVLSAYHAGSTRVKRRGATPFAKTDSYVRKVLGIYYALRDRR